MEYTERFIIKDWVCDYGIWDNQNKKFIGNPIHSFFQAQYILNWLLTSLKFKEIEILK